ncbi:hypothetical protein [Legionella waltersii]|uniref:Uncharacterized protein n=1 Tax=Legionella waltersii TaxID=66969 RepID=A0A0W1AME5_9GAMM|nr:hypothetical protein [Legionella waltersii]KTD82525.1 hypothetical protein Lwal_0642 [Legionella waltersii]SNV03054.1 Uncharacterised protein [Legionella waltersii]
MGREKREFVATYRPMPDTRRFLLYSESCYTQEELSFREWVLKTRASSGIHSDYLVNPSSWFASDDQALINVYEGSWFFSNAYRPRHGLTQEDFHVRPIDSQRMEWPPIYDLMQNVGDYLLLRTQDLSSDHLNHPMNYVLLDVNNMLKGLSQNPNIQQVKEQLELITRYVRTVEKNISPLVGSDRLFLANFRQVVDSKIQPHLDYKLETQLLRDKLGELSKEIRRLSTERNRVLHFALNQNKVNPHPYEYQMQRIDDKSAYPTQAAKECASKSTDLTTNPIPSLFLSSKQLKDCKDFKLISSSDKVLDHYGKAVSDLNELERFQKVIQDISDLLGQAGEVYTVYQFKRQMLTLLNEINLFIGDSSVHINEIIEENTQAYHKAIRDEQDLSLFKKWFSNEQEKLNTYIKNQDTLSQYPSTTSDLSKTQGKLTSKVNDVVNHLSNPKIAGSSFETITGQTQELNKLIGSMHNWISTQHELKGLPSPPTPAQIAPPITPAIQSGYTASVEPVHYPSLFNSTPTNTTLTCASDNGICTDKTIDTSTAQNSNIYLGLLALIPVGVLLFILVYKLTQKKDESEDQPITPSDNGSKTQFNQLKIEFDDLLTQIQRIDAQAFEDSHSELSYIVEEYEELISKTKSDIYNTSALESALIDLQDYYETVNKSSNPAQSGSNH